MRLKGPLGLLEFCGAILALHLYPVGPAFVAPVLAASDDQESGQEAAPTSGGAVAATREVSAREFDSAVATPRVKPRAVKSLLEMRHEKTIIQKWDLSCGAAALATILTYQHGDPVPEREVAMGLMRREAYVEHPSLVRIRQGFSLLDLKRYVDRRGYEGVGFGKLELQDLIERAPIMVPVNFKGYNHFVIFRGMRADRVLLADPAWGNRTMTSEKFERAWITYPKIDKVGFVVLRRDGTTPSNQLVARPSDFVSLR